MVERLLFGERIEITPITTLDVEEAVAIIAEGRFSLALIDVMMYGAASGFTLIERLRQQPATSTLPLVITSGAQREIGQNVEFLRRHGCDVLLKPFEPDALLARLRESDPPPVAPAESRVRISTKVTRLAPRGGVQPA
jgi:DNA-binding response OmpR family regulator